MDNNQKNILENIEKNGLLPSSKQQLGQNTAFANSLNTTQVNTNIFSAQTAKPTFGSLTIKPKQAEFKKNSNLNKSAINGFDTDILVNSKYKKIDDKSLKLQVKIARLKEELDEHKKIVENAYLKSDRNHYQKLLEIQERMEAEIQKLVAEYQSQQLKSVIFSPFIKLFHFITKLCTT